TADIFLALGGTLGLAVDFGVFPNSGECTDALARGEFDVAFEASGAPQALVTCLQAVRRGGIVVQVGTLPADGMHLPANQIMAREIDLRGSFRFGNVFELAVDAIAGRRVDVRPLISGAWPLQQAAQAIESARDKTRSMKVHLVVG
ncbi:MAG TPA: zinc-binding dehydrogenase, partial [Burkholderiaceae bacterium]|nr:zinc-binding dehydrogenase [Burkholderiaceae bacterium]